MSAVDPCVRHRTVIDGMRWSAYAPNPCSYKDRYEMSHLHPYEWQASANSPQSC